MVNSRPFVHLFQCSTGFYVYDVNTDLILKVKETTYECLREMKNIEQNSQIQKMKQAGYLKNKHVQKSEHPMTPYLESFYKDGLNAITLQVTQNCNMRCDYCIYSGKYNTRTHTNKKMDFQMAKKSIDFLLEHSEKSDELTIGFYGGEPLLEFDLIKECVLYMEEKMPNKKHVYIITTNATLLTPEIVAYFVKYNFNITISFDGPREIHDKNRRFANSDKGSFDIVMKNAKYIKEAYPTYFSKHVKFNSVLSPEKGYKCIGDFIRGEDLFKDSTFLSSVISDIGIKEMEKRKLTEEFIEERNYEYFKLFLSKIGKVCNENVSVITQPAFNEIRIMRGGKQYFGDSELPDEFHHSGPCIPGKRSVFINSDGKFYPCEKVCEKSEVACMGDLEKGINIEKAQNILNIEKIMADECQRCWAYRYCNFCVRYAEPDELKLKENMLKRCKYMREHIENAFKDYCVMKEIGYDFETECMKNGRVV